MPNKFYSQNKQDEYIYNRYFKEYDGDKTFLEIGADDGIRFSNCKFFEESLGWNGIAIEARKSAYEKLKQNRNCICINAVLSDKEEETDFMELKGYGLGLSGLVDKYDKRHLTRIESEKKNENHIGSEIIKVKTVKLGDILKEHNMNHIDFLSIDTEGSELDILKTVDFNKISIDVITIEDNYNDPKLTKFFIDKNYKLVQQIECDKIFEKF
jgi:FkbM family methyltransferase